MTASSFDIAPNADDAIDDVDMERLRAKYSRPREQLVAEANAKGYGNAEPMKAFNQSDQLADIVMCGQCSAMGTVKKQYGYRVIEEQCETCGGEGVLKKGLAKKASDELKAKCKRVEALVEACEDLDELEKLEEALSKKTAEALDAVLKEYGKGADDDAKEAAEAVDVSAGSAGGSTDRAETSISMSAEELKAKDAEELKKKQEAERKKAEEQDKRDAENAKRDAEIAAKGKRAAGGMHKFDPDEVDVHGGNATADDFLDAFGF